MCVCVCVCACVRACVLGLGYFDWIVVSYRFVSRVRFPLWHVAGRNFAWSLKVKVPFFVCGS